MAFTNSKRFPHAAASGATALIFTALVISGAVPWTASEAQTASPAAAADRAETDHRKSGNDLGITGHGFVRDSNGAFTPIDVPDATTFTLVLGTNERGKSVGAWLIGTFATDIDERGRIAGTSL